MTLMPRGRGRSVLTLGGQSAHVGSTKIHNVGVLVGQEAGQVQIIVLLHRFEGRWLLEFPSPQHHRHQTIPLMLRCPVSPAEVKNMEYLFHNSSLLELSDVLHR